MYFLLVTIHVIACFVLISVILLQAGRGAGLGESFGGSSQTIFGQKANVFLKKATSVCAIVFLTTSLSLGIISTRRGRSLLRRRTLPINIPVTKQNIPVTKQKNTAVREVQGNVAGKPQEGSQSAEKK